MQAIPTTFGGVNYRSRLEADWALFFHYLREHTLQNDWQHNCWPFFDFSYEDQDGVDGLDRIELAWRYGYKPDFRLQWIIYPDTVIVDFLEVKPCLPTADYMVRLREIGSDVGKCGYHLMLAIIGIKDTPGHPCFYEYPYSRSSCSVVEYICRRCRCPNKHTSWISNMVERVKSNRWDLTKQESPCPPQ